MRTIALWLVASLVFTFPTEDMLHVSDGFGSVSRAVGMGVSLFWFMTVCMTDEFRKLHVIHLVLAAFLLWNAASIFWSADVDRTAPRIVVYVQLLVSFCILWDVCRTPAALRLALQAYVFGTYVAIGSQLYNYSNSMNAADFARTRFTPTGVHPNSIGLIVALSIPIAWHLAITSPRMGTISRLLRYLNYAYIPMAYFCIALAASRGSVIASVPAVLYIVWTVWRRDARGNSWVVTGIVLAVCGLLAVVPQHLMDRLGETGTEVASGELNGRMAVWEAGIGSLYERPIIGVGASAFPTVNPHGKSAHNSFLSILIDVGLVGLVIFAAALVVVVYQATRTPPAEMAFWLALLGVWFLGQMGHNWEHTKHTWFVLGVVAIAGDLARRQPHSHHHSNPATTSA